MKYLSVCSGVEAASQAWMPLGWEAVAFSEIEPFPCAVLASRFPNVPNLGDMSKIHYNRNTKELTNGTDVVVCRDGIDLLVGGTPCQSFSVAGKRAGLEGASGLAFHYARLIGEIQPRWFVWENVPGALSSVTYGDQRDFNFLLQQFGVGGNADLGVRWNCCWRVLDTQYVRVEHFPRAIPQRRRRVFIVGHLAADCGSGCEVLLESEGVRGNPAPRRVKGQGVAGDSAASAGRADVAIGVKPGEMLRLSGKPSTEVQPTLTRSDGKAGDNTPTVAIRTANTHANGQAVAYGINPQNGSLMVPCTNAVGHENGVVIRSANSIVEGAHGVTLQNESATTLQNGGGKAGQDQSAICVRTADTHANGCGVAVEASHTMDGANGQAVAIGIDPYNSASTGEVSKTLNTAVAQDTDHTGAVAIGIGRDAFNSGRNAQMAQSISTEVQPPITAKGPGGYAPMANHERRGCDADA